MYQFHLAFLQVMINYFRLSIVVSIFSLTVLSSCKEPQKSIIPVDQDLIAVSWFYPNNNFQNWLLKHDSTLTFVNIYDLEDDKIDSVLKVADGYLLTGGCDVNPAEYGMEAEINRCGKIDPRRDSLEFLMVDQAFANRIPILGVCRGMQVMNIVAGGDLIVDLPADRGTAIHQVEQRDAIHEVRVVEDSRFHRIVGCKAAMANSNHHQAPGKIGSGYEVMAYAPDSVVEAFAFQDTTIHPFALGVHWHPERMSQKNPLAGRVARSFITAARK